VTLRGNGCSSRLWYSLRWFRYAASRLLNHLRFLFVLGGPFDFCAFALLSELLLGSLEIALKCTRPRQRFMYVIGRYSMTEGGMCQGEIHSSTRSISSLHPWHTTFMFRRTLSMFSLCASTTELQLGQLIFPCIK